MINPEDIAIATLNELTKDPDVWKEYEQYFSDRCIQDEMAIVAEETNIVTDASENMGSH